MATERIEILKSILLDLHQGASAEAVQARFDEHFTGVSALEISLMEHELMNTDTGITFEDVMALCNVHANLFKNAVQTVEREDTEHPGHPVQVFKQENLALRAAMLRIRRLLENYENADDLALRLEIKQGLMRQLALLAQFDYHYRRKEELFFPIMERYGHDAPPRVMWGVDDQIRALFAQVMEQSKTLDTTRLDELKEAFERFSHEFEEMIFKEESILLMILLETFSQDDWLQIAEESDVYGYAIIRPTKKWQPYRHSFEEEGKIADEKQQVAAPLKARQQDFQQVIETSEGELTISFKAKKMPEKEHSRDSVQPFGNGHLSVEQANLILNHLPLEITFVNKEDIFQYYNISVPAEKMMFKRTPSQVGRHVDLCHPPHLLEKVRSIFTALRSGKKDTFTMWFKSESKGKFVHVTYQAVRDEAGEFQGVLEYVQDIQPFRDIKEEEHRGVE